jgi:hypothetical protein
MLRNRVSPRNPVPDGKDALEICPLHAWDIVPAEAIKLQNCLRRLVVTENPPRTIRTIAGVIVFPYIPGPFPAPAIGFQKVYDSQCWGI